MASVLYLVRKPVSALPGALSPSIDHAGTVVTLERVPAEIIDPPADRRQLDYDRLLELVLTAGKVITL